MWRGYENALALYMNTCIMEWKRRGYKNNMLMASLNNVEIIMPPWLGNRKFHASHKANLLRKKYEFYSKYKWKEDPDMEYFWPSRNGF